MEAVHEFLEYDIPSAFMAGQPLFYFPRDLATPSLELLFAMDFAQAKGLKLLVGQDKGGKFVGHNELKRPLGKLAIITGRDKNGDDIKINRTIIDFSEAQGRTLSDVMTVFGVSLPELHACLLEDFEDENVLILDESTWIDQYARNDIAKQYRRMLAYSCVHAAMLEWFTPSEFEFGWEIILPQFDAVSKALGVKPLIVQLMDTVAGTKRDWNAYPPAVLTRLEVLEESRAIAIDGRSVPK